MRIMRIIHRRRAGSDVHKKYKRSISVYIGVRVHGHKTETFERVFGTFTQEPEQLRDWLKEHKVKQVSDGIDRSVLDTGMGCAVAGDLN